MSDNQRMSDLADAMASSWGDRVARRREALHFSQAELADMVGLNERQIRRFEQGDALPRDLIKLRIAAALRSRLAELFPYPTVVPPAPGTLTKAGA
jgi:transcriptional regulator with XRE-family HTH domain